MPGDTKINQLLSELPKGAIVLSSWLSSRGYSHELQTRYRKSGWFRSIGRGAMVRTGDSLKLTAAVAALQHSDVSIHIGGRSALGLLGYAHYIEVNIQKTTLFAYRGTTIPLWLKNNRWDTIPEVVYSTLFKNDAGLVNHSEGEISLKISGAARAIMECLSLCPDRFSLSEAYEIMEGLNALRPAQVQELLVQCSSIKTKRLFLHFADRLNHPWLKFVDIKSVNLGSGKRSLVKNGTLTAKYDLVLPEEFI